jgi:hypothetical protein
MAANKEHDRAPEHEAQGGQDPALKHETGDVNVFAVTRFGIGLVLLCLVAFALLFGLFRFFQAREAAEQPPAQPGVNVTAQRLPPEPRLQSTPVVDLRAVRAAEDQILNDYAWVDPDHGVVRIPIEKAIDLLARRGLPARPGAGQPEESGATVPTESGLGPIMLPPGGPLASQPAPSPAAEVKK